MTTGERATKPGPELTALRALYARHAPDLERHSGDHLPMLLAAARSHVELAAHRTPGEPLIRVRDARPEAGPNAGPVVEIITDDMPFLVQSLLAAVARTGGEVTRVIHPIVVVRRAADGSLEDVLTDADPAAPPAGATVESWIHLDLEPLPLSHDELAARLSAALRDVREIVDDAEPMLATALRIADDLPAHAPPGATAQPRDVAELLRWLTDDHITFLGYRHYTATADGELVAEPGSGLGVLRRDAAARTFAPRVDSALSAPDLLVITRASSAGPLRPEHPYYLATAR